MPVFRNVLPLTLLPVGSGISRPLFILGYLLGSRGDSRLGNDYAKTEHSFHLHISYLSNARSINFAEGARLLLAQETVTAEQFPAIQSVGRKEKSAASVESD